MKKCTNILKSSLNSRNVLSSDSILSVKFTIGLVQSIKPYVHALMHAFDLFPDFIYLPAQLVAQDIEVRVHAHMLLSIFSPTLSITAA